MQGFSQRAFEQVVPSLLLLIGVGTADRNTRLRLDILEDAIDRRAGIRW